MKNILYVLVALGFAISASAQDSSKTALMECYVLEPQVSWLTGHSGKTLPKGTFQLGLQNRFGSIDSGVDEFFGLDQSSQRIFVDYGLLNRLQIGLGRSSANKTIDGYGKFRFWNEAEKPIELAIVAGAFLDTRPWEFPERENFFTSRLGYNFQIIAAKSAGAWSFQLTPGVIHRNLISLSVEENDVINVGVGAQYRLNTSVRITAEYFYNLPDQLLDRYEDPIALGVDIRSGANLFQFSVSNGVGLNERSFITETTGSLADGELHLGFTYAREFRLKKRK